jgi:ribosomal protein S18 acetylase RimI-like enzyme
VIRTEHLSVGPLDEVLDPAFAWDEGEGDRTYEDWLTRHSAYWQRVLPNLGAEFTPKLGVVLERFSVVWPQRDEAGVLAAREDAYVRPVWIEDRDWLADIMRERWDGFVISRGEVLLPVRLPALVALDRGGLRIGALTFRPRPGPSDGVETEVVTVDALESGRGVGSLLLDAAATLARRDGWRRLWLVTTNDNTAALRLYQRAGWDLVAFHRNALTRSRSLKPSIPQTGRDSIPIRHEFELELPLPRTLRDR